MTFTLAHQVPYSCINNQKFIHMQNEEFYDLRNSWLPFKLHIKFYLDVNQIDNSSVSNSLYVITS